MTSLLPTIFSGYLFPPSGQCTTDLSCQSELVVDPQTAPGMLATNSYSFFLCDMNEQQCSLQFIMLGPEIVKRFQLKLSYIEEIFPTGLTDSSMFEIDPSAYTDLIFTKLEDILETEEVWKFKSFIQSTVQEQRLNIMQLKFKQWKEYFLKWAEEEYGWDDMAESVYINDEDEPKAMMRNRQLEGILKLKKGMIEEFKNGKNTFTEDRLSELLKLLLSEFYVYEFREDYVEVTEKPSFQNTLKQVVRNYESTKGSSSPNKKKIYFTSDIPQILKCWQKINPQFSVQDAQRHAKVSSGTQTQQLALDTFRISNTSTKRSQSSYEDTLNNIIELLKQQKNYTKDMDCLESINYLLVSAHKQRKRFYSQYKNQNLFQPVLASMHNSFQLNPSIEDYLKEIYEYYLGKVANEAELIKPQGISFLGEYADQVINSKFGVLRARDIDRIVRQIVSSKIDPVTQSKASPQRYPSLRDSTTQSQPLTLQEFIATMKLQIKERKQGIDKTAITLFVHKVIRKEEVPLVSSTGFIEKSKSIGAPRVVKKKSVDTPKTKYQAYDPFNQRDRTHFLKHTTYQMQSDKKTPSKPYEKQSKLTINLKLRQRKQLGAYLFLDYGRRHLQLADSSLNKKKHK